MDTLVATGHQLFAFAFQWGHGLSAMDTWLGKVQSDWRKLVSMGHGLSAMDTLDALMQLPQMITFQWGHGLSAMDTATSNEWSSMRLPSFNGAMAFQLWIQRGELHEDQEQTRFQWGHGLSAMDTSPRMMNNTEIPRFQWGHGLSAMDTIRRVSQDMRMNGFQWGHGLSAMDTRLHCGALHGRTRFNGAMAFQLWIQLLAIGIRNDFSN